MLNKLFSILHTGAFVPVMLMLPNILWMIFPGEKAQETAAVPLWLNIVENIGRIGILVLPFFFSLDLSRKYGPIALAGMALALAVYYFAWGRYVWGGRTLDLMGEPLLGMPLPLAVAPTIFLLLSAYLYLMGSWWMFGTAFVFGAAHIWVSALSF